MPIPDALPDSLRHAIDQTVAAERLEGWRPTDEHIGGLVALVCNGVSFGQYLAVYRARYPADGSSPHRDYRHIFRRSRPYLIPGTTVLRNNFGVDSQAALSDREFVATAGRIAGWHCRLAEGTAGMRDVDVQTIVGDVADFLEAVGCSWDRASVELAEYFKEWRLTEVRNPARVEPSSFVVNLAALRTFYRWAAPRFGVVDPVAAADDVDLAPRGARRHTVKWLDPGGYRRWRDLGVRGLALDGRADRRWRGRNEQRDSAFVDGLYGTGLRLTEWGSVVLTELPGDDLARGYSTCRLADACAKGGYGHPYWLPWQALTGVLDYVEGARARGVRQAQQAGRYETLRQRRLVVGMQNQQLVLQQLDGTRSTVSLNVLDPAATRELFQQTRYGLEPLALWLNEDGLPRVPHGWQHTFVQVNERIARLGVKQFSATPHMLRHSCALRWYAVGRLAYEPRFAHLSEDETKDFRQQFGDTWDLVATYLGHRSPETAKRHYLEPFRALDVEILLQHAHDAAVERFLASYLADHPLMRTDPLGTAL